MDFIEVNGRHVVVKQIHHEPCGYYQFGNKIQAEMNDYVNAESMEAITSYERSEEYIKCKVHLT